jgi:hypothetical protein
MGKALALQFKSAIENFSEVRTSTPKGQQALHFFKEILNSGLASCESCTRCPTFDNELKVEQTMKNTLMKSRSHMDSLLPLTTSEVADFEDIYKDVIESVSGNTLMEKLEPALTYFLALLDRADRVLHRR